MDTFSSALFDTSLVALAVLAIATTWDYATEILHPSREPMEPRAPYEREPEPAPISVPSQRFT